MNFATLKRILTCRGDCGEGGVEQLVAERRGIGLGDVWPLRRVIRQRRARTCSSKDTSKLETRKKRKPEKPREK
jgi:hypothetical protein